MTLEIRPDRDIEQPPEPWRDRARQHLIASRATAVTVTRRRAWETWRVARQLPGAVVLLVRWSPRGLVRLAAAWWRYLRDEASDELRLHAAREHDASAAEKAVKVRHVTLRARLLTSGALVAAAALLVLAWTAPDVLAVITGVGVLAVMIRVLPWRAWQEVPLACGLAGVTWWHTPTLASLIPFPPTWALWTGGGMAVLLCGWAGRPQARPLVTLPGVEYGGRVPPLTAPMVTAALVALGNSKMKDPDSIKLLADPHRHGPGVQVDLELPPAVTAGYVVSNREPFAGALRRELGTVWPSVGPRHPGHLRVYVSDQAMVDQVQEAWPLLRGGAVDLGERLPQFTDQRGHWVDVQLAYANVIIGAVPRMGKTFTLRQLLLTAGLDPSARVYAWDGKGTGDLAACVPFAHSYLRGPNPERPEKIEKALESLRELRRELVRRADVIDSLPPSVCPENKVTSELIRERPDLDLGWRVLGIDETQMFFGYGERKSKEHAAIRDELAAGVTELVKLGPALGFVTILATQQVKEQTIPTDIAANAVVRYCLKMEGWEPNDRVLGTGAYKRGIDAQMFDFADKGIGYLKADGSVPIIARSVWGLDGQVAHRVGERARALRAGRLTGDAANLGVEDAVIVLDEPADVREALARRGTHAAHLSELVDWLAELRPEYGGLDVDELGKRLRNRGMTTGQVWVRGRNGKGVDLRKQEEL